MRKRIQLRGISRTPSDRMTSDGGCAESLNVQLEEQEIAPILPPEDVTGFFGETAAAGLPGPSLFMHKVASHVNLIFLDEDARKVFAYVKPSGQEAQEASEIIALHNGETINGITSVGNTLVISTSLRMEYVLFKNGEYIDLGDQIPIPAVEFKVKLPELGKGESTFTNVEYIIEEGIPQSIAELTPSASVDMDDPWGAIWNEIKDSLAEIFKDKNKEEKEYSPLILWQTSAWKYALSTSSLEKEEEVKAIQKRIWEIVNASENKARKRGFFATPIFVRYAVRLYDGTYIYQSVPILIKGGKDTGAPYIAGNLYSDPNDISSQAKYVSSIRVSHRDIFKVKAILHDYDIQNWTDIVESIDLFVSTSIHIPEFGSDIVSVENGTTNSDSRTITFNFFGAEDTEERVRNEVLSKNVFFKVASFPVKSLKRLADGYDLLSDSRMRSEDYIATQNTLPDDFFSMNRKLAKNVSQYNKRLVISNIEQEISSGYQFINGLALKDGTSDDAEAEYEFKFHILDGSNNVKSVLARNAELGTSFSIDAYSESYYARGGYGLGQGGTVEKYRVCKPFAWLAYPDPRCFKVDVRITKGNDVILKSYDMEEHPNLNCAFLFLGLDKELGEGGKELTEWDTTEDRIYREDNIVWQSVSENPFAFQAAGRLTFYSDIISIANATKALSEGQFGQFPVYVFTMDGIWAVPVSDEGGFASTIPMSRDVALSKESVIPIEQAIVFVSEQGVMLLEGSQVTCLSPNMNGAHYKSPGDLLGLLSRHPMLKDYTTAFSGDLPFKTFVSGAKVAFDYSNRRLLLFNEAYDYQYVYVFKTQTWHKMSLFGKGIQMYSALNSYPDCFVDTIEGGKHFLRNFSVEYDPSKQQETLPGLIITRPFDLDEPDIRKAITDLRIRGNFARGDVKYVLLASMDGIHWGILPSLRGGSYKLFRLALLTDLSPTERISWIDIDYETRFDNRLR